MFNLYEFEKRVKHEESEVLGHLKEDKLSRSMKSNLLPTSLIFPSSSFREERRDVPQL
jgi:hypothetical protein